MEKKKILAGALMFSLLLLLLLNSGVAYAELTPPLPGAPTYDISVEEAHEMLAKNPEQIILLDVRTEGEYCTEYIPGAMNIPSSDLESRLDELDNTHEIIVYCKSCGRSSAARDMLAQHDFVVYNMLGGINAWKEKFATSTATPMPTLSPAVTPLPTPAASPSPITSPITTPVVPGFKVTFAIAAISLIAWCLLRKRGRA
jgi:rhodanese-related sulfurtransferase